MRAKQRQRAKINTQWQWIFVGRRKIQRRQCNLFVIYVFFSTLNVRTVFRGRGGCCCYSFFLSHFIFSVYFFLLLLKFMAYLDQLSGPGWYAIHTYSHSFAHIHPTIEKGEKKEYVSLACVWCLTLFRSLSLCSRGFLCVFTMHDPEKKLWQQARVRILRKTNVCR